MRVARYSSQLIIDRTHQLIMEQEFMNPGFSHRFWEHDQVVRLGSRLSLHI